MKQVDVKTVNTNKQFSIGMLCIIIIWTLFSLLFSRQSLPDLTPDITYDIGKLPNFSAYTNTQQKKHAFFDFLFPIVVDENIFLMKIRKQLLELDHKYTHQSLSSDETEWLNELKRDYLIESDNTKTTIQTLLKQIDSIPPSLILAQAAIESGWGTSRFARQANNLFGHWCFSKGCGIVPRFRDDGKVHEIAKFESINESIRSYLKNLNSFHRYEEFRTLRSKLSENNKSVLMLLPGLQAYSEQGDLYIKKVTKMIKQNKLQDFDSIFIEQLSKN